VEVVSGGSTPMMLKLAVAGTAETINVTAATPVIDIKKESTTTNVSYEELQNIPSARDPWVVMQSVPTVYMDRVNVGGSESGQQSGYNAKGASSTDNTWAIDGVPVTDMGATGSSSFYYDFDSFQEMAITTGGADAQNMTGGVQLNMVLKKGSNTPKGGARIYYENDKLQAVNISPELSAALKNTSGPNAGKGNRTDQYKDFGFDLGGPIIKDKLWGWGTIARRNINLLTLTGLPDTTNFKDYSLKIDGQVNSNVRGNFTFYENNKIKTGRSIGPTRLPETAWNQTGPTKYYKGEGNFVVGGQLTIAARIAYVDGGFQLAPAGGLNTDYYADDGGVWHNTYYQYQSTRPQHYAGADANYFAGKHELKFGFAYRKTPVDSQTIFPGSHVVTIWNGYPNMLAQVTRDWRQSTDAHYANFYANDTVSMDRLTVNLGVRFDNQVSSLAAASVPAVAGFETLLPALTAPAVDGVYKWNNLTPRVGITYAADDARKTIVRASYAMFASQLQGTQAGFISPIQYSYVVYNAVDKNGDGIAQKNEILFNQGNQGYSGFDPNNPSRLSSVNVVGANHAPRTHEILGGVDKELMPNFAVSTTFTYRLNTDLLWSPLTGVTSNNYTQTGVLTGTAAEVGSYSVPLYALNASAVPAGGGKSSTNRSGYNQKYMGLEISASKRLANHWMTRVGFSTNSWNEYFTDPSQSIIDPTKAPAPSTSRPFSGAQIDGGPVVRLSSGSGKSGIYMVAPHYQLSANGMYQAPLGLDFGLSYSLRQGYSEPFFRSSVSTGDPLGRKTVLIVNDVAAFRLPAVNLVDGRIEKKFTFQKTSVALDLDIFNILNSGTILGKQYDARLTGATGFDQILEIMNPRVARLGLRFFF
jgi:hypothetical protein